MGMMTVRLPEKLSQRLDRLAKRTKRTKTSFIREIIEDYIVDYEDGYLALERLNQKNARYMTTEEVEKELGL